MTARAQKMPAARQVLDKAMDEDSLLVAVTDALTVYGWRWTHSRRDGVARGGDPAVTLFDWFRTGVTLAALCYGVVAVGLAVAYYTPSKDETLSEPVIRLLFLGASLTAFAGAMVIWAPR